MKIENQVCTLEQAKKLSELGISQESLFIHDEYPFSEGDSWVRKRIDATHNFTGNPSAYTVAELGVMLPTCYDTMRITVRIEKNAHIYGWFGYDEGGNDVPREWEENGYQTEAQCRAEMVIYLIENKIITIEEVNERLLNE